MSASVSVAILVYLIPMLIMVVAGVLLIVFSRARGTAYPSCGRCGYDVSGSIGSVTRCPECGRDFTEVGILPPGRKRNPFMIGAGVVLIVLPLGCFGSTLLLARGAAVQATAAQRAATAQQAAAAQQPAADAEEGDSQELNTEAPSTRSGTEEGED